MIAAAALLWSSAPALAQESGSNSQQPASANSTGIGPDDLSDFSLEGRVTREADRPAPSRTPPANPAPERTRAAPARPAQSATQAAPSQRQPTPQPEQGQAPSTAAPTSDATATPPASPDPSSNDAALSAPAPVAPPSLPVDLPPPTEDGFNPLPWIAGLLLLGGLGAVGWFVRQRRQAAPAAIELIDIASPETKAPPTRSTHAQEAGASTPPAAAPPPSPPPSPPPAQPAAVPSKPVGIVSSSLRPQIDAVLVPVEALIDDHGVVVTVTIILANVGTAPAREVTIDAKILNAGPQQDVDLAQFLNGPRRPGDKIPHIAPQQKLEIRTTLRMPRNRMERYKVGDRLVFTPMIAVVAHYGWGSGKEARSGAGFLVGGMKPGNDRLTPFRADAGERRYKELGARRYEKGVRT